MIRRILSPTGVLILAIFLWGSTFVVVDKILKVAQIPALWYLTVRFIPAAVCMMAYAFFPRAAAQMKTPSTHKRQSSLIKDGFYLGILQALGLLLQVWGQEFITPSRSAFLTAFCVPLVPLYAFLMYKKRPTGLQIIAALLGLIGQILITYPEKSLQFNWGDVLMLASAALYALVILETSRRAAHHDTSKLAAVQVAVCGLIFAFLFLIKTYFPGFLPQKLVALESKRVFITTELILMIVYMSLICTVFTFFIQNWAMARVNPTEAAVIFALEPIFAAIIEYFYEGSAKNWYGFRSTVGALLVCFAIFAAEVKLSSKKKKDSSLQLG